MTRSGCPPFGVFSLLVTIATGSTIVPAQVAGQSLGGRGAAAARTERAPRYDGDPGAIVATQLRRDLSMDLDDNFAIMIDPTLGHRNGYIFEVNPLGTQ